MYYEVKAYSMKCRAYLNKTQQEQFDRILHGVRCAHNMALYDAKNNHTNTKPYTFKNENNEEVTLYYVDTYKMAEASYLKELREKNEYIKEVPASALSSQNGLFRNDINKKFHDYSFDKKGKPIPIDSSFDFYSKKKPRRSYSYQETVNKFSFSENKNVFYLNAAKLGLIKVRGWNQKIRFDESCSLDFIEYIKHMQETNVGKQITITLKKDNCNDYWIIFKLSNVFIDKPNVQNHECGVDVGIKNIMIFSDGVQPAENKNFAKEKKKTRKALNRRMSRRQGWANEEFRERYKSDKSITPSKRYQQTVLKNAKMQRKIMWKRNNYNNIVTTELINRCSYIGIESLNVKGMFSNRHLAAALADVGLSDILGQIEYKGKWYHRTVVPIDQWKPSSKRCSICGFHKKDLKLGDREWDCPECKTHHDRDYNASVNILYFAKQIS